MKTHRPLEHTCITPSNQHEELERLILLQEMPHDDAIPKDKDSGG